MTQDKPKWTENYNCHRLAITRGLTLKVDWDSSGGDQKSQDFPYQIFVFDDKIGRAKELAKGKECAIATAKTRLQRALELLEGVTP